MSFYTGDSKPNPSIEISDSDTITEDDEDVCPPKTLYKLNQRALCKVPTIASEKEVWRSSTRPLPKVEAAKIVHNLAILGWRGFKYWKKEENQTQRGQGCKEETVSWSVQRSSYQRSDLKAKYQSKEVSGAFLVPKC